MCGVQLIKWLQILKAWRSMGGVIGPTSGSGAGWGVQSTGSRCPVLPTPPGSQRLGQGKRAFEVRALQKDSLVEQKLGLLRLGASLQEWKRREAPHFRHHCPYPCLEFIRAP